MAARGTPITTKTWHLDGVPFAWSAHVSAPDKSSIIALYLVRDVKMIRDMPRDNIEPRNLLVPLVYIPYGTRVAGCIQSGRAYDAWWDGDDAADPMPLARAHGPDKFPAYFVPGWFVHVTPTKQKRKLYGSPFNATVSYSVGGDGILNPVGAVPYALSSDARAVHQALFDTLRREQFALWPAARPAPPRNRSLQTKVVEPTGPRPWIEVIATYDWGDRKRWTVAIRRYVHEARILVVVTRGRRETAYTPHMTHALLLADLRDGQMVPRPPDRPGYIDVEKLDLADAVVMQETFSAAYARFVELESA